MDTVNMTLITFIPRYRLYKKLFPQPIPATQKIPDWWKSQESYLDNDQEVQNGTLKLTVKKCQSVFDAMSFGYYLLCPMDIHIDATEDRLKIQLTSEIQNMDKQIISEHLAEQLSKYPIPEYFHKQVMRIHPMWLISTEKGYSSLFTSPIHGDSIPVQAFQGVIDTDEYPSDGYLTFFVKKGFKGILKQGTPIIQVIPFKREEWESTLTKDRNSDIFIAEKRVAVRSVFQNGYRLKFWNKKTFK
jgi:hypothetical protein